MFGKRRGTREIVEVPTVVDDFIERSSTLDIVNQPLSAVEAFDVAGPRTDRYGRYPRLFLVLSGDVNPSGLATEWEFHYIFPEAHAEGIFTVRAGGSVVVPELLESITPYPAPGTPEHVMLASGGGYMANIVETAWQARLERIERLPVPFVDSTVAVHELMKKANGFFAGGPMRLKGRTPPGVAAVWEASTASEIVHTPFA